MRLFFAALAALAFALPAAVSAQPAPGEVLNGTLQQTIDTKSANVGQPVNLINVSSSDGKIVGARLAGTVTNVVRAGQGRPAQLQMHFNTLRLANGTTYHVDGVVVGLKAQTKSNAVKEAAGAVGGMIVGNVLRKTLGVNGGGLIGAAGGFLVMKNSKENMTVPAGSVASVKLQSARRQAQ
jgi:hypothetical protein